MKKVIAIFCVCILFFGCSASIKNMRQTQDQSDYVDAILEYPLEFEIPKTEAADAWGRAQSFIGKYSSMKLQTATDYIIQTYNPTGIQYGYYVTKTPLADKVQFTVECMVGNPFKAQDAKANSHILAYYIATGKLPYPQMIQK